MFESQRQKKKMTEWIIHHINQNTKKYFEKRSKEENQN